MKYQFASDNFGYGHSVESQMGRGMFAPRITFEDDNGAGGGSGAGGVATPPASSVPDNAAFLQKYNIPPDALGAIEEEIAKNLKLTLEKERARANAAEKAFKKQQDLLLQQQESIKGIDPEKYKQFEQLQAQAEQWGQRETKLRSEFEEQLQRSVQVEQGKVAEIQEQYNGLLKRTAIAQAYQACPTPGRMGGGEDGVNFFDSFCTLIEKTLRMNDKGELEVLDNNGVRRYSSKDASKLMSATEYFSTLSGHPVYGQYFQAPSTKGGGMTANARYGIVSQEREGVVLSRAEQLTRERQRRAV
jgi:hypothetical protein